MSKLSLENTKIFKKNNEKKGLLVGNPIYKPFRYPWCYDAWLTQQRIHWLPEEVPMSDDVRDWQKNITPAEKNLLMQIFRFFTQADVEVNNYYMGHCMNVFKPTEVKMMLSVFSAMETVHMAAYAHLLDTVGLPETEYSEFLKIKAMRDKYDYLQECKSDSLHNIAKTVAICSAFTEGVQLFASFAILLNFPRHNKMKGMGQIITWSVRDETLHCNSMIRLFNELIKENPEVWTTKLKDEIYKACGIAVAQEDAMINLAFEQGPLENLKAEEVKQYIRWIANRRLTQLNLSPFYKVERNPLTWLDTMLNAVEHMNFFEGRSTEYSKASTQGTWTEAFEDLKSPYFDMLEKNKIIGKSEFFKGDDAKPVSS
ncbi:MAG: ribonucleotide-diphosphate reductase subunit beta [Pelagibacteraceae bacterium]|nr:ribonucleotide-diphosphate reductase subunit beta [Pelagibacteraceae bacterium]